MIASHILTGDMIYGMLDNCMSNSSKTTYF